MFRLAALLAAIVTPLAAQLGVPAPSRFPGPDESFDVVSVKANQSGSQQWDFDSPPGRVVGTNVLLRDLIRFAYFIYGGEWDLRIAGPGWIKTARFDIDATTPGAVPVERSMSMLRRLLADRFALRVHYETRQHPVYALVVARADGTFGPRLERSTIDCAAAGAAMQAARAAGTAPPFGPAGPDERPVCGTRSGPGELSGGGLTMTQFALHLASRAGRTVIDRTGLNGSFDWDLTWADQRDPTALPAGPSIFTAIQEQLGLKLEPAEGPVEVLVIDSIAAPAAN